MIVGIRLAIIDFPELGAPSISMLSTKAALPAGVFFIAGGAVVFVVALSLREEEKLIGRRTFL